MGGKRHTFQIFSQYGRGISKYYMYFFKEKCYINYKHIIHLRLIYKVCVVPTSTSVPKYYLLINSKGILWILCSYLLIVQYAYFLRILR